ADRIRKRVLRRQYRDQRTFSEGAVSDFPTTRAGKPTSLSDGEGRKIIVEDKRLRRRSAGETVEVLGFLRRPERNDRDILRVPALERGAAMDAGKNADFRVDRTEGFRIAAVGADALFQHVLAVGLVLQVFENDVQIDFRELAFAEFRGEGGLGFFL